MTIIRGKGNYRFVCGADEKVARVFEAPLSFLKTLNHTTSKNYTFPEDLQVDVQILGANMSALGLSQKPIYVHCESLLLFISFKCVCSANMCSHSCLIFSCGSFLSCIIDNF